MDKSTKHNNGYSNGHIKSSTNEFYESFEEPPYITAVITYLLYVVLNLIGRIRDILRNYKIEENRALLESRKMLDFVPLYQDYEAFYTRNMYRRIRDCWNRPICSVPGPTMELVDRISDDNNWSFKHLPSSRQVINFGSYNYLGFAQNKGPCAEAVRQSIYHYGLGIASSRLEVGNIDLHCKLEKLVAQFTHQEAALVFPMGFATNSTNIPVIAGKGSCVISDELNHTSLILGIRLSGAHIKRFKHNDMNDLEHQLRNAIVYGQPRTTRPFHKIIVIVEGIYSMEGSIVRLPEIIQLKQRYNFLLYVDEAHSIGALGINGRGVVDYFENCVDSQHINSVDNSKNRIGYYYSSQIDVAMGTFTKSFAGAGGYVAGPKRLIEYIREHSHGTVYGCVGAMPGPVAQQILTAMNTIMYSPIGSTKIQQLAWNTRYFRSELTKRGFILFGNKDSPVIPVIICKPTCLAAFSRECLKRNIGTVVVGFPATAITLGRARFCMSAGHTKQMLDEAIKSIDEVGYMMNMKFSQIKTPEWCFQSMPYPSNQKMIDDDNNFDGDDRS